MARCGHTSVHRGKKVLIRLRNGMKVIGQFLESKSGVVVLMGGQKFPKEDISSLSIYRGDRK